MRQIDNMTPAEIDTLKLKGMLGTRKAPAQPDLCIEVFNVRGNKGTIYSKQMKCEFPSSDIAKDVGKLAKEWLDLREAWLDLREAHIDLP
jgi:hypothetical protein